PLPGSTRRRGTRPVRRVGRRWPSPEPFPGPGGCKRNVRKGHRVKVSLAVNGTKQEHDVEPRLLLVHYLREVVGLTGTNVGCDTTSCGACTVLLNGESVKSCTMLAVQADGTDVTTIEGLASGDDMH